MVFDFQIVRMCKKLWMCQKQSEYEAGRRSFVLWAQTNLATFFENRWLRKVYEFNTLLKLSVSLRLLFLLVLTHICLYLILNYIYDIIVYQYYYSDHYCYYFHLWFLWHICHMCIYICTNIYICYILYNNI